MDVLVVRHAISQDKDEAQALGVPDAERALTKDGQRRMKQVARGLARSITNLSAVFSSPWRRAAETADLLRARFQGLARLESDALLPDAPPEALAEYLSGYSQSASVAVVGHEPQLSQWVSWCLVGLRDPLLQPRSILQLRKAGACLLRFDDRPGPSLGQLIWLMTPGVLREL